MHSLAFCPKVTSALLWRPCTVHHVHNLREWKHVHEIIYWHWALYGYIVNARILNVALLWPADFFYRNMPWPPILLWTDAAVVAATHAFLCCVRTRCMVQSKNYVSEWAIVDEMCHQHHHHSHRWWCALPKWIATSYMSHAGLYCMSPDTRTFAHIKFNKCLPAKWNHITVSPSLPLSAMFDLYSKQHTHCELEMNMFAKRKH